MFNRKIIQDHLNRLDLADFNISAEDLDNDGDYIKCYLPELDYEMAKARMKETKYYKKFLDKFTMTSHTFSITDYIDGYKTFYKLVVTKENFGVSISALVKRIDYYDRFGNYRPCLGFEMFKDMVKRDKEDEEVTQALNLELPN